jgi:hypothetical protein
VLAVVSSPRLAWAGGGAATDAYEGIEEGPVDVHGLLDVYGQYDFQRPASGQVQYRAFDTPVGLSLALLRVTVAHKPDPFGFRVDAAVGDLPNAYLDSDPGQFAAPALARGLSYLEQAFVTVSPPPAPELEIDAGKFSTPVGFEDNESITNWNYSRSLLFTLAEPTYHTGVRATYGHPEGLSTSAFWLNGWNTNIGAGNGMRSFAAAATWRGTGKDPTEASVVYAAGPERAPSQLADPTESFRQELDAYVSTTVLDQLDMAATLDYGIDTRGGGVSWWGVAGFLRYRFTSWLALAARGEYLADPDGFLTGVRQRLAGTTTTLQVKDDEDLLHLYGWLEYRRDQSDMPVFPSHSAQLVSHQDTLTVAAGVAF